MVDLRSQVDALICDRHSAEARALFVTLAGYVDRRTDRVVRYRYADLISVQQREELVAEVLIELMSGALATFRGETLPSLLAFVRSISDRFVWRLARRRIRERDALDGDAGDAVRAWAVTPSAPDAREQVVPVSPLNAEDSAYLRELLGAGSRAALARRRSVSRAAVTQRVQRIRARIDAMSVAERDAAEAWMAHEARCAQAVEIG